MKRTEVINGALTIKVNGYVSVDKNYENGNTGKRSHNHNHLDLDLAMDMAFDNLSCSTQDLVDGIKKEIFSSKDGKVANKKNKRAYSCPSCEQHNNAKLDRSTDRELIIIDRAVDEFTNRASIYVDFSESADEQVFAQKLDKIIKEILCGLEIKGEKPRTIKGVKEALIMNRDNMLDTVNKYRHNF